MLCLVNCGLIVPAQQLDQLRYLVVMLQKYVATQKMKLAMTYDDWMNDIHDHKCFLTLKEHIETCLDEPRYIGINENPTE